MVKPKIRAATTVIRSRLRSTTVEPAAAAPMPPPNMSESPPPLPLSASALEKVEASPPSPEQALRQRQDRERVYRALDAMSPKKRLVLYLHEIEGRDLKEIAYVIDANPVTVRTRLFYARREFYRLLAEDGEGGES